jgi:hypothetical protein
MVSPVLETDGVEADRVGCSKNDDGTLFCTVGQFSGTAFKQVVTHGTEDKTVHYGPQESPHVEIEFDEATRCVDNDRVLVCRRDP